DHIGVRRQLSVDKVRRAGRVPETKAGTSPDVRRRWRSVWCPWSCCFPLMLSAKNKKAARLSGLGDNCKKIRVSLSHAIESARSMADYNNTYKRSSPDRHQSSSSDCWLCNSSAISRDEGKVPD